MRNCHVILCPISVHVFFTFYIFSCTSAKAVSSLSSLSCVCVYVDQNKGTPPGNSISTGNSLISSPDLDSPQKINLPRVIFIFKWIPSNNSVTNLFLILQNYLRPFQTWRHPSSPNYCKPLSQSECRHNKKSCHLLDKKGTHPMRMHDNNTTCNRSNQNVSLLDTHSHSTNQHPATPDTTKTTCY